MREIGEKCVTGSWSLGTDLARDLARRYQKTMPGDLMLGSSRCFLLRIAVSALRFVERELEEILVASRIPLHYTINEDFDFDLAVALIGD